MFMEAIWNNLTLCLDMGTVITMVQLYVFGRASGQYFSLPSVAIFDFESRWGGLGRAEIALDGAIDQ